MSRQGLGARPPRAISPQTQSPRHLDALLHQNGGDSSDKRRIRSRNAAPFRSGLHCVRDVALWIGKESYIDAFSVSYGNLAAFSMLYSLPSIFLYVLAQKFMSKGFTLSGANKG